MRPVKSLAKTSMRTAPKGAKPSAGPASAPVDLFALGLDSRILAACIGAQNSRHGVVAFMAGVLEHVLLRAAQRDLPGPGLRVEDRIVHLECVFDHVVR